MAACWARCTITADMETVETTADATMASIIALITCTETSISRAAVQQHQPSDMHVSPMLSVAPLMYALLSGEPLLWCHTVAGPPSSSCSDFCICPMHLACTQDEPTRIVFYINRLQSKRRPTTL